MSDEKPDTNTEKPEANAEKIEARTEHSQPSGASRVRGVIQRHPWLRIAGAIAALLLAIVAVRWWWGRHTHETTDDAQIDGDIYPISARITGPITMVYARDGQFVSAGAPLVDIDARDYEVALARARAEYEMALANASASQLEVPVSTVGSTSQIRSAQADLVTTQAGVVVAQKQVDEAQAQLAQANAAAKTANADVERFTPLIEKREISQQQYDQTLAAADTANAAVAAATAGVRRAEEQVRQAGEKIRQADAGLDTARATTMTVEATVARAKSSDAQAASAKAELQQAELNMSYTHILAPVDGIVGRRTAQVGQNVEPGQELLTITPTRGLWVTANFKETQLSRMRPNQPVEISVDGCGQSLNGHVTAIGGATGARYSLLPPENATGNYVKVVQRIPVRIDLDATDPGSRTPAKDAETAKDSCLIRPGMSVLPSVKVR